LGPLFRGAFGFGRLRFWARLTDSFLPATFLAGMRFSAIRLGAF
jgi:hypothetical protein